MTTAPSRWPAGGDNLAIDARTGTARRWRDLPERGYPAPAAVGVATAWEAAARVWQHARTGAELLLCTADRLGSDLVAELTGDGFTVEIDGETAAPTRHRTAVDERLWLLTSGSTGRAKRIGHTLTSLTTVGGDTRMAPQRWLNPYAPGSYAWWQLVTLSLAVPGQELVLLDAVDLDDWADLAVDHDVTAVSGTPTFWRRSMIGGGEELARVPLRQVTLGGEPVDQAVIDRLAELFEQARISWIYASSEAGASIVVHDGRAGFPADWLDRDLPGRPRLQIASGEDGQELVITSPHHGDGLAGPLHTGDRVERRGDRVHITGRIGSDELNVGGAKVSAGLVRNVLQAHAEVAWAQVTGRRAPLVGTVVQATVVPRQPHTDTVGLERRLAAWCREKLPEHGVPRRFVWRTEIPVKESLKSDV